MFLCPALSSGKVHFSENTEDTAYISSLRERQIVPAV